MKKSTKIWLYAALVICILTTILNFTEGRYPSVLIALGSIAGLCILLFCRKKAGFILMCVCYVLSFAVSVIGGIGSETGMLVTVLMSLIGSSVIPVITALFLRGQWDSLR